MGPPRALVVVLSLAACEDSRRSGAGACREFIAAVECGAIDLTAQVACDAYDGYQCDVGPYFECLKTKYVCDQGSYDPAALSTAGECASQLPCAPGPGPTTGGSIGLTVRASRESASAGGQAASSGHKFVIVDHTLVNQRTIALPLGAPLFSLRTSDGLEYLGDLGASGNLADGCDQSASVSPGATVMCSTAFSIPSGKSGISIVYHAPDQDTAEAPLSPSMCESCGSASCVDLSSDPENCGACGRQVGLGRCEGGIPRCDSGASNCSGTCVDLSQDTLNCGQCGHTVPTGAVCFNGQVHCSNGGEVCAGTCLDVRWDVNNCGACGKKCGANGFCVQGQCGVEIESMSHQSCNDVCGTSQCTSVLLWVINQTCGAVPHGTSFGCAEVPGSVYQVPTAGGTCVGDFLKLTCRCVP